MSGTAIDQSDEGVAHDSVGIWKLVDLFLLARRHLALWTLLGGTMAVAIGVLLPARFTVDIAFRPQNEAAMAGQLSSLAAQFGVSIPGSDGAESPDFYIALLETRGVLSAVTANRYATAVGDSIPLDSLLEIDEPNSALRQEIVFDWLRSDVLRATSDVNTGIVNVGIRTKWPHISTQIAARVLSALDEFNAQTRRSQASAEYAFVDNQVGIAQDQVRASEETMRRFLERNRTYTASPQLVFEHDRLRRDLDLRQQLYASLREAFEQAKIAAVRDTPVITVVQPPYLPAGPDSRWLPVKLVLGAMFGFACGASVLLLASLSPPPSQAASGLHRLAKRAMRAN